MKLLNKIKELWVLYVILGPNQRKWLLFLKNNPEKQYKKQLGLKYNNGNYYACCLGQAGLMFGYCKWTPNSTSLQSIGGKFGLPDSGDNEKYLGLRDTDGSPIDDSFKSLSAINDTDTWMNVYNTLINKHKLYFTKRV